MVPTSDVDNMVLYQGMRPENIQSTTMAVPILGHTIGGRSRKDTTRISRGRTHGRRRPRRQASRGHQYDRRFVCGEVPRRGHLLLDQPFGHRINTRSHPSVLFREHYAHCGRAALDDTHGAELVEADDAPSDWEESEAGDAPRLGGAASKIARAGTKCQRRNPRRQ